jgi:hypothetical protein
MHSIHIFVQNWTLLKIFQLKSWLNRIIKSIHWNMKWILRHLLIRNYSKWWLDLVTAGLFLFTVCFVLQNIFNSYVQTHVSVINVIKLLFAYWLSNTLGTTFHIYTINNISQRIISEYITSFAILTKDKSIASSLS